MVERRIAGKRKEKIKKPNKLGTYLRAAALGTALVATPIVMGACGKKTDMAEVSIEKAKKTKVKEVKEKPKEEAKEEKKEPPKEEEKTQEELNQMLLKAVKGNKNGEVEKLIEEGASIDIEDEKGNGLLWIAVNSRNNDLVKKLLENGADASVKDPYGRTLLIEAVIKDNIKLAEMISDAGVDVDEKGPDGENALMKAIAKGNESMVKLLMESNADINAKDDFGETCIWKAWYIKNKNSNILKIFIENGADMDVKSASVKGVVGGRKVVREGGLVLLSEVIKAELTGIVELMIENGADVNATDSAGVTPIMWSVYKEQKDTTEILLGTEEIDLTIKDDKGETVLMKAKRYKNNEMVELIENYGAVE